jgi:hypothetical protein
MVSRIMGTERIRAAERQSWPKNSSGNLRNQWRAAGETHHYNASGGRQNLPGLLGPGAESPNVCLGDFGAEKNDL